MTYQTISIKMPEVLRKLTRFCATDQAQVPLRLLQVNLNTTEW